MKTGDKNRKVIITELNNGHPSASQNTED